MQLQQFWEQLLVVTTVSYMGKKWPEHGIIGAPPVQEVRGNFYL